MMAGLEALLLISTPFLLLSYGASSEFHCWCSDLSVYRRSVFFSAGLINSLVS